MWIPKGAALIRENTVWMQEIIQEYVDEPYLLFGNLTP